MTERKNRPRIVITGMGMVCPVGHDIETAWQALLTGQSGVAPTTLFDASTMPTQFSAEVKDYNAADFVRCMDDHQHANRGTRFALGATAQACRQAAIDIETSSPQDGIDRVRMGIYLGAGDGAPHRDAFFSALVQAWQGETHTMDWQKWTEVSLARMDPMHELEQEANMTSSHLALLTRARGPVRSCLTACAASTQAVGEACHIIWSGDADIMITGGAHSMIHPLGVMGFNRLTALSTRNDDPATASRPFSDSRDGFVLGEGAATLVIETLDSAQSRGVPIFAEIIGYGSSADAFRVTDMHEEGRGPVQAIKAALIDAGLEPGDIDYINAHGTSTEENDSIETLALKRVFGSSVPPVSSVKSTMGHLIGAAGAAELIACVLAIRDNILPPTSNLYDPDPHLDLDYIPNTARTCAVNTVMKESFGFGGQNNVLIIRRFRQ